MPPANVLPESEAGRARTDLPVDLRSRLEQRLERARHAAAGADRAQARPAITRSEDGEPAPLSHAQERLWFLDQLMPDRGLYNVYQAMRLGGRLDEGALGRALDELIARHEVFRTNFRAREDGPMQVVGPAAAAPVTRVDLSALPADQRETTLFERLRTEARRPFDLTRDLLLRAVLVRLGPDEHALLLVMHHIVSDGWSLGLLFRELGALHEAYSSGRASPLPGLPIRFADYARWERATLRGEAIERPLAYWRGQLAGAEALDLPTDRPRPAEPSIRGATRVATLPAELVRDLRGLCQREGATLFMALLAGFQALLHRYTRQEDIVIGSCVAGRHQVELEQLAGFFVNTLVLRTSAAGRPTFREWLHRTRETVLGAMAHQDLPFEKLVAELQPDRSPVRNPFFQVMFVLQSAGGPPPRAAGLTFTPLEFDNGTSKFDLSLSLAETAGGEIRLSLEYRMDLFESGTIERLLAHYQALVTGAAATPDRRVDELPLLTAAERRQLEDWSGRRTAYPRDETVVSLFARQVARLPDAVAVQDDRSRISYRELDQRANRLARHFRRSGAQPGTFVALCLERSPDVIVTLLAILKTGAAYVSLDPAYPPERIGFMLADATPVLLVTEPPLRALVNSALAALPAAAPRPAVVMPAAAAAAIADEADAPLPELPAAESLAYVSYTSGSTGRPKGVCIPHRAIVRLLVGTDYVRFGPEEVVLQFAPVAFDASTFEVWAPLLHGGRVAVCPPGLPTLAELGDCIERHGVTTAFLTTGLFHQMIDEQAEKLAGMRQLLAGGEALSPEHAARALARLPAGTRLFNVYGPTENTTFTTAYSMVAPLPPGPIPIGRPIANTTVHILDANRQRVPVGVPGELYTGGDGLATGYLRRAELDAERFVPDPFSAAPGARLYRTGDLARWRSDGTIEFLGRVDRQLKLRGFRIEPGEIEAVLATHPAVGQAAVLVDSTPAAGPRLVAYVSGRDGLPPDAAVLRLHLQEKLPEFMVPAVIVAVPVIPLNANGKIDRSALPAADVTAASGRPPLVAPRDPTETALAAIWEKILGVSPIGIHDTFFQLGGHSMAGVRLFARIEREFGVRLPLASLFEAPTVAQLAARIRSPRPAAAASSLVRLRTAGTQPPVFFVHGAGGGNLWIYTNLVPHLPADQPVFALESRGMRGLPEFASVEEMAAHYVQEVRGVQAHGPYYLAGYCFGGNVAYEMARQLEAAGEPVGLVALLDASAANSSYQQLPWWRPSFHARFALNTADWLRGFLSQPVREQLRFASRKGRLLGQRFGNRLLGRDRGMTVEEVIDTSRFPEWELELWQAHLRAIERYRPRPYGGRVTLFRTRGHPFLCSFDPCFGWSGLAQGGVEIVPIPGAHEQIFMAPNVSELGARFREQLARSQNQTARAA
ncbi:MAG TPA: amino acid adenylation domain-containing protein [Opitutaceae bacterium]|nr:amino acid adenylation domain-containing protein [Opitutaceae bacterium]